MRRARLCGPGSVHEFPKAGRDLAAMESSNVWKGLAFGGIASCIAEAFTLPIDVVKTRLQLQARSPPLPSDCSRCLAAAAVSPLPRAAPCAECVLAGYCIGCVSPRGAGAWHPPRAGTGRRCRFATWLADELYDSLLS